MTPVTVRCQASLQRTVTDEIAPHGVPSLDYIDMPTFVWVPTEFTTGMIEVDALSRLKALTSSARRSRPASSNRSERLGYASASKGSHLWQDWQKP